MRMIALELAGFGPYRTAQRVNFSAFDEDGLFLIGGRTGAGKSSVLDAVAYALYGRAPRYGNETPAVRSNFCAPDEPTEVALEFEHAGELYRIERSLDRQVPKANGEGMRNVLGKQSLARREGDDWVALATKKGEIANQLAAIFPLTADEFLQVVLLAQNEFQRFLTASSDQRQNLLRKLFRTHDFQRLGDLAKTIADRRRATLTAESERLNDALAELHRLNDSMATTELAGELESAAVSTEHDGKVPTVARLSSLRDHIAAVAESRAAEATTRQLAHDRARAELSKAELMLGRQQRRQTAQQQLTKLEAETEQILKATTVRIDAATAAAPLQPLLVAEARADGRAKEARKTVDAAKHILTGLLEREQNAARKPLLDSADDLDESSISELRDLRGTLRAAGKIDAEIVTAESGVRTAEAEVTRLEAQLSKLDERMRARPLEQEQLQQQLDSARLRGAALESHVEAEDAAKQRARAASELEAARAALDAAARALVAATSRNKSAAEHEQTIVAARFAGFAAELAENLSHDEACPVCGSLEHPMPAHEQRTDARVTEVDLTSARAESAAASEAVSAANDRVREAERTTAELEARSGGLTSVEANEALAQAAATTTAAREANELAATLERQLRELQAAGDEDAAAHRTISEARNAARSTLASAMTTAESLRARHDLLRDEHESVAARLVNIEALVEAAERLSDARAAHERAASELATTSTELAELLAASRFNERSEVREALLDDAARTRLADQRDAHFAALAAVRGVLADTELTGLPDDAIDLVPFNDALARAVARSTEAHRASGAAATALVDAERQANIGRAALTQVTRLTPSTEAAAELAGMLRGHNARKQNLEAFVLAASLEEVIAAANARLGEMTSNRYTLELDDDLEGRQKQSGLGLAVLDAHTGEPRKPESLSGGETFLVSLALALGLADVVSANAGGISLDTLFIDEGFGSLDRDTLEIAMRTLDRLRDGGRTIGVISHVEAMQDRIPARLDVIVVDDGSSALRETTSIP